MSGVVFALIAFFGWGIGDVYSALGSRKIGAYSFAFWSSIFGLVLSLVYAPFAAGDLNNFTPKILLLNIFLGVLLTAAWYVFNKALETANPTIVGIIGASFTSLVVALSLVVFREVITPLQLVLIIIAFAGVVLSSLDFKVLKKGVKFEKGILLAILTMVLWGIYFTFIRIPIEAAGWYWPGLISGVIGVLFYLIVVKIRKKKVVHPFKNPGLRDLVVGSVLVTWGGFSFYLALERGLSSVVAPIAGSYPVLFVLASYLVFRERITRQQVVGILLTLIGIISLSFVSA